MDNVLMGHGERRIRNLKLSGPDRALLMLKLGVVGAPSGANAGLRLGNAVRG